MCGRPVISGRAFGGVYGDARSVGSFFVFQGGSIVDCLELGDSEGQVAKPKSSQISSDCPSKSPAKSYVLKLEHSSIWYPNRLIGE